MGKNDSKNDNQLDNNTMRINLFITVSIMFFLASCKIADIRTPEIKNNVEDVNSENRAKALLKDAITKQGLNKVSQYKTYEVVGSDHWKGLLGKIANIWNWKKEKVAMRFALGDFDGQIEVLEGKKKGHIFGIQSWDYYEIKDGVYNTDVKDDKRIIFGLGAYHYYFELANRLNNATFFRYIGEDELANKPMEKVFVSWGNERTKAYDQYILWIGKESGKIEAATHTVRDTYLPMSGFLYSSIRFEDFRVINGISIPFKQTVQLKKTKNQTKRYIHQFTIETFKWDAFSLDKIRPNKNLQIIGDEKMALKQK